MRVSKINNAERGGKKVLEKNESEDTLESFHRQRELEEEVKGGEINETAD